MKQAIWKYKLDLTTVQAIDVVKGAKFISAEQQNNEVVVYAEVDPDEIERVPAKFLILGTGERMTDLMLTIYDFLSTVSILGGQFMWHVFVEKEFR